jgi:hypothetical protein
MNDIKKNFGFLYFPLKTFENKKIPLQPMHAASFLLYEQKSWQTQTRTASFTL